MRLRKLTSASLHTVLTVLDYTESDVGISTSLFVCKDVAGSFYLDPYPEVVGAFLSGSNGAYEYIIVIQGAHDPNG